MRDFSELAPQEAVPANAPEPEQVRLDDLVSEHYSTRTVRAVEEIELGIEFNWRNGRVAVRGKLSPHTVLALTSRLSWPLLLGWIFYQYLLR